MESIQMTVLWLFTPCRVCPRCFEGTCCLHLQGHRLWSRWTLKLNEIESPNSQWQTQYTIRGKIQNTIIRVNRTLPTDWHITECTVRNKWIIIDTGFANYRPKMWQHNPFLNKLPSQRRKVIRSGNINTKIIISTLITNKLYNMKITPVFIA